RASLFPIARTCTSGFEGTKRTRSVLEADPILHVGRRLILLPAAPQAAQWGVCLAALLLERPVIPCLPQGFPAHSKGLRRSRPGLGPSPAPSGKPPPRVRPIGCAV